jgi:hypothetical protein
MKFIDKIIVISNLNYFYSHDQLLLDYSQEMKIIYSQSMHNLWPQLNYDP